MQKETYNKVEIIILVIVIAVMQQLCGRSGRVLAVIEPVIFTHASESRRVVWAGGWQAKDSETLIKI